MWNPETALQKYRPCSPRDVTAEEMAGRLAACQACPLRSANRCRSADQIVSVLARRQASRCPRGLWPGQSPRAESQEPTRPAVSPPSAPKSPPPYPETAYRWINRLAAVTCHFNPCGYQRLEANYHRFRAALPADLPLWTVELAFDSDPFRLPAGPRMIQIRGRRERHNLWQKERLLNLAIRQLPAVFDAVAWLDADLIWLGGDWTEEARQLLMRYNAVQLFNHLSETDAAGHIERTLPGYVRARQMGQRTHARPGGAWAARREALPFGMYDRHILGGGDSATLSAWEEAADLPPSLAFDAAWLDDFREWESTSRIGRSIACIGSDVVHLYHGTRERRRYVDRYQVLHDGGYDPRTDISIDPATGLLQWTDFAARNKPEMLRGVTDYFASRREDD